jgi:hypothetical protein
MLKTQYFRDGRNQIVGTKTTGFESGEEVARDRDGRVLGHSSSAFGNTRDAQGKLVSRNEADTDLLLRR